MPNRCCEIYKHCRFSGPKSTGGSGHSSRLLIKNLDHPIRYPDFLRSWGTSYSRLRLRKFVMDRGILSERLLSHRLLIFVITSQQFLSHVGEESSPTKFPSMSIKPTSLGFHHLIFFRPDPCSIVRGANACVRALTYKLAGPGATIELCSRYSWIRTM